MRHALFCSVLLGVIACGGSVEPNSSSPPIANGGGAGGGGAGAATTGSETSTSIDGTIHTKLRGDYHVLAVDETDVFVAGFPGIVRIAKTGGEAITLTTEIGFKSGIALDETYVYYTRLSQGEIVRMPKAGGPSEVLARDQVRPHGIAVDADTVYWASEGNAVAGVVGTPPGGQVASRAKRGESANAPVKILAANEQCPVSVALDGDWLYFANGVWGDANGMIKRVKKTGGGDGDDNNSKVQTLAERRATLGVPSITVVDGWVAWHEGGANMAWKTPLDGVQGNVLNMGPASTLTGNGHDFFVAVKVDRDLEISGYSSAMAPLGMKGKRTFAKDETWFVNAMAADAKRVYWLDYWWSYREGIANSGVHSVPR